MRYLALGVLVACGPKPVAGPGPIANTGECARPAPSSSNVDPQVRADLDAARKLNLELNNLVRMLQDENARLQATNQTQTIEVAIDGPAVTVKPAKPGERRVVDDKAAALAAKEFVQVLSKARAPIQSCYVDALKKNAGLQQKVITLTVSASFTSTGAFESLASAPSLGDTFDACLKNVAASWKLSQGTIKVFKGQVSLTPQ